MTEKTEIQKLFGSMKGALGILFILALCFVGGFFLSDCKGGSKYDELLLNSTNLEENLTTSRNRVASLEKIIGGKDEEAERLRGIINTLEERPEKIRYIVRTETVVEGRTEIVEVLPEEYIHRFDVGLPVASVTHIDDTYQLQTADVTFTTRVVIGENQTGVQLEAVSSLEPEVVYDIPVQSQVSTRVREQKIFMPHIGAGITGSLGFQEAEIPVTGDLTASFYTTLFHPNENLDILGLRFSANTTGIKLGVDPVGYNIGSRIPFLTDLWIIAGVSVVPGNKYPSIDLTIGSKF